MSKERYVSREVARLLNEKGFEEPCNTFYCKDTLIDSTLLGMCTEECVLAPTQQMACDWVQIKGVLITYDLAGPFGSKLVVKVYRKDYDLDWIEATTIIRDTLEDAINDALEYALKNLI